jgi:hypothetical protein
VDRLFLLGKPKGYRPLGKYGRTWEDVEELGCEDEEWIHLDQTRICEHGNHLSGSMKAEEFLDY